MKENSLPLLFTVREVSLVLRINRPKVYDLIYGGIIEGFKVGADWRVRRESIERLIGPIPENSLPPKRTGARPARSAEPEKQAA